MFPNEVYESQNLDSQINKGEFMKYKTITKKAMTLAAITLAATTGAQAQEGPPRGADIDRMASSCNIGPFEQVGKAGIYNGLCTTMTDSEKCLALIKGHMISNNYEFRPAWGDTTERVEFCLDHLRSKLLPPVSED